MIGEESFNEFFYLVRLSIDFNQLIKVIQLSFIEDPIFQKAKGHQPKNIEDMISALIVIFSNIKSTKDSCDNQISSKNGNSLIAVQAGTLESRNFQVAAYIEFHHYSFRPWMNIGNEHVHHFYHFSQIFKHQCKNEHQFHKLHIISISDQEAIQKEQAASDIIEASEGHTFREVW